MRKREDEISVEELQALTGAIKNRYGIDFTNYEKKSLRRGFSRLMQKNNIDSLLELWSTILKNKEFFKKCLDDLTVNLTELFRNPEIWEPLEEILESFVSKGEINIWHAGCATGEEVYSMAMVASRKDLLHKTRLLGTDISTTALNRAEKGCYPKELLPKYERSLKKYLRNGSITDMFHIENGQAQILERIRKRIRFDHHNLVSDSQHRKFDMVFCRNVLIYFDDSLKMKVLEKLVKSLKPDGYLILGYYDMLPEESREIIDQYDSNNRIYTPVEKAPSKLLETQSLC